MSGLQIAIREDDLRGPEIAQLLRTHLDNSALHSPPESIHALDLDALRAPEITFWTAWNASTLVGCGGLKELDPNHGEIKSMHTAQHARGHGVGRRILAHIVDEAVRRGYGRLSLETGSMEPLRPPARSTPASASSSARRSRITWKIPTVSL